MIRTPSVALGRGYPLRQPSLLPFALLSAVIATSLLAQDWIAGLAIVVLWAGWQYLQPEVGPPILPLVFSAQWAQVVAGIFYYAFTGRQLPAMYQSDYRPMVLIGLGCLVALLVGLKCGTRLVKIKAVPVTRAAAFSWPVLVQLYLASVLLTGFLLALAWSIPQLTQPIVVFTFLRLGFLFLIFRRLCRPRVEWGWLTAILVGEVALGFTGYFAEFREALMIAALALLEIFDRRQLQHWLGLGVLGVVVFVLGLVWMSIKGQYRGEFASWEFANSRLERLERVGAMASQWLDTDFTSLKADVDSIMHRMWAVYYPALALRRVPAILPHEHGALLWGAIHHVLTPRLLFPDKADPPSDSELVRKYSGVWVAGPEQGTTIAFGYAAESYVDFGVPWMFLPILLYGALMGSVYHGFLRVIRHRELAVALVSIVLWLSLGQFERSWLKTLGLSGTMIIYLGGTVILIDRYLLAMPGRRGRLARAVTARPERHV